ncbi:hypothetical protein ACE6H2_007982 [Prunus campanulata]
MLKNCSTSMKIKFLRYEQSSQCKTMRDSRILEDVFSFETSSNLILVKLTVMCNSSEYAFHEPS